MKKKEYIYKSVIIHRSNLLYDIDFESYKTARVRVSDKALQMESSTDDEAAYFIERSITAAIHNLVSKLLFCVDRRTAAGEVATNRLRLGLDSPPSTVVEIGTGESPIPEEEGGETSLFPDSYTLGFRFSRFWCGNMGTLASAIHGYLKSFVLSEWFSMVLPDAAPKYIADAASYLDSAVHTARMEHVAGIYTIL